MSNILRFLTYKHFALSDYECIASKAPYHSIENTFESLGTSEADEFYKKYKIIRKTDNVFRIINYLFRSACDILVNERSSYQKLKFKFSKKNTYEHDQSYNQGVRTLKTE